MTDAWLSVIFHCAWLCGWRVAAAQAVVEPHLMLLDYCLNLLFLKEIVNVCSTFVRERYHVRWLPASTMKVPKAEKLRWARMDACEPTENVKLGMLDGRRGQSRPKFRWLHSIERIWKCWRSVVVEGVGKGVLENVDRRGQDPNWVAYPFSC